MNGGMKCVLRVKEVSGVVQQVLIGLAGVKLWRCFQSNVVMDCSSPAHMCIKKT